MNIPNCTLSEKISEYAECSCIIIMVPKCQIHTTDIVFVQNEKHSGTVRRVAIVNTINFELIDENLYELKQHFGHLDRKLLQ